MAVPKAAVGEDDGAVFGEDQIRGSRKPLLVFSKAQPEAVEPRAKDLLRLRVLAPDARHHASADSRGDDIRHRLGLGSGLT